MTAKKKDDLIGFLFLFFKVVCRNFTKIHFTQREQERKKKKKKLM